MKHAGNPLAALAVAIAALLACPTGALACAVCYGRPGDPLVQGANAGVLFLLIVIAAVLAWFVGLIVYFARRARRVAQEHSEV